MEKLNRLRIAVDGPSGAGKSTVAKKVAQELEVEYVDTGAMYRAIALKISQTDGDVMKDEHALKEVLDNTEVTFFKGNIMLDGKDVSGFIITPEITALASSSSALPIVREKLVFLQRKMGENTNLIMDGRDIGSNVFCDAEVKFYITASPEVRADRRYKELIEKDPDTKYEDVLEAIKERDYNDSHRELNPMVKTEDAIEIDTDNLSIDEVAARMLEAVEEKMKK